MKIASIVVRTLMGLMFIFASASYFLKLFPPQPMEGAVKIFNDGIVASVYLIPTLKTFELICGICLVAGLFVPLANVVLFPAILNILLYHAYLAPETVLIPVLLMAGNLFLAYYYRAVYAPLFRVRS